MSSFETEAIITARVDERSVKRVRDQLEAAVPDKSPVLEAATPGGNSGGSNVAARDRARQRKLLTEGLDLDTRRNDLLERMLEAAEDANYTRARSGGGGLGTAAAGIGLLGAAVGGVASAISNFKLTPPDIGPKDVVDAVDLGPLDVVSPVALTVDDIVGDVEVTAADLVETAATVPAAELVATGADVTADALIDGALDAADLIKKGAIIPAAKLVDDAADIKSSDVIDTKLGLKAHDILDGKITAEEIIKAAVAAGAATGAAGTAGAGSGGTAGGVASGSGAAGGVGLGFPTFAPWLAGAASNAESKPKNKRNIIDKFLADLTPDVNQHRQQAFTATRQTQTNGFESKNRASKQRPINVTVNAQADGISEREVRRVAESAASDVEKRLAKKLGGRR